MLEHLLDVTDLPGAYLVACWFAAACAIIEIQKIARREIMAGVRTVYRHVLRVLLALLAALLAALPLQPAALPPTRREILLVVLLAVILLARAAAGCKWARVRHGGPPL